MDTIKNKVVYLFFVHVFLRRIKNGALPHLFFLLFNTIFDTIGI